MNKKKALIARIAAILAAGLAVTSPADASFQDKTVIDVSQRTATQVGSLTYTSVFIRLDSALTGGTSCTDNAVVQHNFVVNSGDAQREAHAAIRQIAIAALLSGKKVGVELIGTGCTTEGFKPLNWIILRR